MKVFLLFQIFWLMPSRAMGLGGQGPLLARAEIGLCEVHATGGGTYEGHYFHCKNITTLFRPGCHRVPKFYIGSYATKILGFQLCDFWAEKVGILKSCPVVPFGTK